MDSQSKEPAAPVPTEAQMTLLHKIFHTCVDNPGDLDYSSAAQLLAKHDEEVTRELRAEIGTPLANSHPDEAKPRAVNWHAERANWRTEVGQLKFQIFNLELAAKSFESQTVVALRTDLAAATKRAEDAEADLARIGRRDSFDLQGINRVVADQTKALQACADALEVSLKEKCIEADTMRQHHKNAEAVIQDLEAQVKVLKSSLLRISGWIEDVHVGRETTTLDEEQKMILSALTTSSAKESAT